MIKRIPVTEQEFEELKSLIGEPGALIAKADYDHPFTPEERQRLATMPVEELKAELDKMTEAFMSEPEVSGEEIEDYLDAIDSLTPEQQQIVFEFEMDFLGVIECLKATLTRPNLACSVGDLLRSQAALQDAMIAARDRLTAHIEQLAEVQSKGEGR